MQLKKLTGFFFLFFLFFLIPINAEGAPLQEKQLIKVACILDHGFFYLEENGELSGYNYDYLQKIAQYTNWEYEFVIIDEESVLSSYYKAMELMNLGEIDLIGTIYLTESNQEMFEFPENNIGISRYCLTSLANNYKLTMDNYFLKEEISVGLIRGERINEDFIALFDLRELNYNITYVDSYPEVLALFQEEKVDAILMTDTYEDSSKVSYLTTIDRLPFYFVTKKGNVELMAELDRGISSLHVVDPDVHQKLLAQYFSDNNSEEFHVSEEEKQALSEFDYINVGLLKNLPPYSIYDEDSGVFSGISVEILESISQVIGVEFRYVCANDLDDLIEKIATEEIDFCGAMPENHVVAQELNVILSNPYLTNPTLWLTVENNVTENALYHMVSDNIFYYEKENLTMVFDVESAIVDLSQTGKNSVFCEPNVAKYYLFHLGINNIESQVISNISSNISLGIGKHLDVVVASTVNSAISHLDSYETEEIVLDHMTFTTEVTFLTFLEKYADFFKTVLSIILLFILVGLLYNSNKFKQLSRQDSMTKLFNSGYFHKFTGEKVKRVSRGCLILVDIDYFKQVNDNYGHQKGDEIIQFVAQSLKRRFRQNDMVARLGGDEFAIFLETACKQSELEAKFSNLLEDLKDNSTGVPISLSVGGYIFTEMTKYEDLYNFADKNLYKVKEQGRNGFLFSE